VKRIKTRITDTWDALEIATPVNFCEVDSMKIVWHGHYLRYAELAREAYCAARGLSYRLMEDLGSVAPIVRCQLEYLRPARSGQLLSVRIGHIPESEPSLCLFYEIRDPAGTLLCVAETVQIFVDLHGVPFLTPPPPVEHLWREIHGREAALRAAASA
jgi:acyl-CoA thioester hydrolase